MVSFLPPTRNTTAPSSSSSSYGQQDKHDNGSGGGDESDRPKPPPPPSSTTTTTTAAAVGVAEVMLLLDEIVNMNNIAANEMLLFVNDNGNGGNRGKALKLLTCALKRTGRFVQSLKEKITAEEEDDDDDETGGVTAILGTNNSSTNQISCSFLMPSSSTTTTTTTATRNDDDEDDDDRRQCTLFKYPLQIDLNTTTAAATSTATSLRDVVQLTLPSVIVYNFALWHHLAGLQLQEEEEEEEEAPLVCSTRQLNHIKKAIALYKQVQRLVISPRHHHGSDMLVLLHKVAIYNNLGHAHQVMGNIKMSKHCFRQLLIVAARTIPPMTTSFFSSSSPSSSVRLLLLQQQQETEEEPSSSIIIIDGFLWKAFYQVCGNIPSSSVLAAAA